MCRLLMTLILLTALCVAGGFADDPNSSASLESTVPRASNESSQASSDQIVEHLLQAAEHLEAAGLAEEAARLRGDARRRIVGDDILCQKEAELECLQEEVDRLRELAGQTSTVAIEFVVIEVDRVKMGFRARDFDKMLGCAQSASAIISASTSGHSSRSQKFPGSAGIVEANPFQLPLFRELREKGAIEVLAHPTVQTVARRAASISVGGEIPIRVKSDTGEFSLRRIPIGTHIEVVPVVLPNRRIRLQSCVELTRISGDSVVGEDGAIHPQISSRRFNAEVELQLGQTLAVARMVSEPVETVVFVTPRLVHGTDTPQTMNVVPATALDPTPGENIPAEFFPIDWEVFGPVVPVMKRRTSRDK